MQHFPEPEIHHDIPPFKVFYVHQRSAVVKDRLEPRLVLFQSSLCLLSQKDIFIEANEKDENKNKRKNISPDEQKGQPAIGKVKINDQSYQTKGEEGEE
jgi:hypothetical protein